MTDNQVVELITSAIDGLKSDILDIRGDIRTFKIEVAKKIESVYLTVGKIVGIGIGLAWIGTLLIPGAVKYFTK